MGKEGGRTGGGWVRREGERGERVGEEGGRKRGEGG